MMIIVDPLDPQYKKVLQNATDSAYGKPTYKQIVLQSGYLRRKVISGAWDTQELMYVFAHNGDQEFGYINWHDPGTNNLTKSGTVTHTDDDGEKGNGTTGYFSTGLDLSAAAKYTVGDDAGFELVVKENTASSARYELGINQGTINSVRFNMRSATEVTQAAINSIAINESSSNSSGHFMIYREATPGFKIYRDGSLFTQGGGTSVAPTTGSVLMILRHNGTQSGFSNRTVRMVTVGGTNTGVTDNYNNWTYYFSNL